MPDTQLAAARRKLSLLALAAIAALVGGWSWSGTLTGMFAAPLLAYLWGVSGSRSRAFVIAFAYYLAAGQGVISGAGVFFADASPLPHPLPGLLLWIGYATVLSAVWGALWAPTNRPARLLAVLLCIAIPPIGVIGGFSPLLAAGTYFPGLGWSGLALAALWFTGLAVARRPFLITLPFIAIAIAANAYYVAPVVPDWTAMNTSLGRATLVEAQYERMESLQRQVSAWSTSSKSGAVLVLPELVGDDWSMNATWWNRIDRRLRERGQTVLLGAYKPVPHGKQYENLIVTIGSDAHKEIRARVPVPISMWKPWADDGALTHWSGDGILTVAGKRTAVVVCYEQLLMWPVMVSMMQKPDVLIAPANDWWATKTKIPEMQQQAVQAWSRIFSVPFIWATNR